jgi:arginine/lysine/ornithine decarboxylase
MEFITARSHVPNGAPRPHPDSPARKSQDAAPIADAMTAFWERDMLTFAIPAHCGGRGPDPEFIHWAGLGTAHYDLPMSHGVDTRDRRWKVMSTAQELFAEAVGAKETLFSTNGSSMNAHVAILTVAGPGEEIVIARNGHKSAFAGLIMSGAKPIYLDPYYDEELEVALSPQAQELERVLDEHPNARAVMVFTPSPYGTSADVRALADICHARGIPLVTDDAWGLDHSLTSHPDLPPGALECGSDLAIGSVHKTLTGLSQTSVLSVGSDRIDTEKLKLCFELEESTSASTLLLSSIDGARRQFVRDGDALMDRAITAARLLRDRIDDEIPELRVVSVEELESRPGVAGVDPTHPLIETAWAGLTGYEADDWLRDERSIDVELVDHRRIVPLITFAHGEAEVDRFVRALRDLVDERGNADREMKRFPSRRDLRTETVMTPRDAFLSKTELVPRDEAVGRVSAEFVTPYPPGIPAIAAGEVVNEAIVEYFAELMELGAFVEGAADSSLEKLRVVAD